MTIIQISTEQFQQYEQQWNQAVEDGDLVGQRQKTNAAYWVAYCYLYAQGGVEWNREQAVQILEQAIQEQEQMEGNNNHDKTGKHRDLLAYLMLEEDNEERSIQLYRQAVPRLEAEVQESGNDINFQVAADNLGTCLFFGRGGDKDTSCAIHWWKAAVELGHKGAVIHLFCCCSQEPYIAEVIDWCQEMAGAEHGHAWAQFRLGRCYEYGEGVKQDLVKAVEWYNKAIAQGYNDATNQKQLLLNGLSPEERSKTMGCAACNQKIQKARDLVQQSFVGGAPLSLWSHALACFQNQEHPPWEAPSPTFLSLKDFIMPQL